MKIDSQKFKYTLSIFVYFRLSNFGNKWTIKIHTTVNLEEAVYISRPSPTWQSEEFFLNQLFQIGQHVALLRVNYIAHGATCCPIWEVVGQLFEWDFRLAI